VNGVAVVLREVRFANRVFWRNPVPAFFSVAFPLLMLAALVSVAGDSVVHPAQAAPMPGRNFYVATMLAFGVFTATFTNVAIGVAFSRDAGVLRRIRATPATPSCYLLGRVVHALLLSGLLTVALLVTGLVGYRVPIRVTHLPALALVVLVGAAAFTALGLACTALVPQAEAAPAVVNAIAIPVVLVSQVFAPATSLPSWLGSLGRALPVRPFSDAVLGVVQGSGGSGLRAAPLAVLLVWAVAGALLAVRFFSWEPRR
jgi:ABC-2 type transport system permease protein